MFFFRREYIIHFRQVFFKSRNNILDLPYKDPSIPEKFSAGEKCFRQFQVRLFGKGFYFIYIVGYSILFILNISISGIWISWLYSQGDESVMLINKAQCLQANLGKRDGIQDQVIGGRNYQRSFGVQLLKLE